jgi:hypothetical protein
LQIRRPFVAALVADGKVAQAAVELAAQSGQERGVAPARFERSASGDGLAARENRAVGCLQGVEPDLQSHAEEPARAAKVPVGCRRQQMHALCVAFDNGADVALEDVRLGAIGVAQPL